MNRIGIAHRLFENRLLYSLKSKLILSFLAISIIPLAAVVTLAYLQFQEALRSQASNQLVVVRDLKVKQVRTYLRRTEQDIKLVAQLPYVKTAMQQLEIGVRGQGLNQVRQMGFLGHPDLFYMGAYHPYAVYHAKYHAFFRELVQTKGYADIWLVSPKGDIIYTFAKRDDFATNLSQAPYLDTPPTQLFQSLLANADIGQVQMTDYGSYPPAGDVPVSFIGAPILDEGTLVGCLIYQLSLDQISDLMQVHAGFWKTGETYLVGADFLARTKTHFSKQIHYFEQKVDSLAVRKGLMGESGVAIIEDNRGLPVLSAYQALVVNGFKWVLLAEVDKSEAFGPSNRLRKLMVGIVFVTTLLVIGAGFYIGRSIAKPIVELAETSTRIASGDLALRARSGTRDEIGRLAEAFNSMTGRLSELIGSLEQQIAEREQAQQALRDSEKRYRGLFENSPVSLWEEDFSQCKTYFDGLRKSGIMDFRAYFENNTEALAHCAKQVRVMDVNKATLNLLGAKDKDELLSGPANIFTEDSLAVFREELIMLAEGGLRFESEVVQRALTGAEKHVALQLSVAPGYEDSFGKVMVSLVDITDRKRMEEELVAYREHLEELVRQRTVELEAANKEMHAFTYTVSHDLRAPLRHMDGFLGLLQERTSTAMDQQSRHYMDAISEAAQKMGLLIDDLLSFSRMGRHALSFQPVDLGTLVHEVIREFEPDAVGREIEWRIADLPAVSGDASLLRMVLVNLIANALKFTRPRDRVEIEIGCRANEKETIFFISDNGVGFDMIYAGKLFGVFQRLHREEEFEGTGIGLANVRRIIARHGGRTWAEGEPDQGASFYFALPHTHQGGEGGKLIRGV